MNASIDERPPFFMEGRDIITAEEHLGLKGFMLTASVPYRDALSVKGLWAPPYASTDFMLEIRLDGEKVSTEDWQWNGNTCRRFGRHGALPVASELAIPMDRRAALLQVVVDNPTAEPVTVRVQMAIRGAIDEVSFWEFGGPGNSEASTPWAERALAWVAEGDAVVKRKEDREIAVATDLPGMRWETLAGHWEGTLTVPPGLGHAVHVAMGLGPAEATVTECRELVARPTAALAEAKAAWAEETAGIFEKLPRLEASDERLTRFYERSLVGLLLNQWRVPEFVLSPYYSTGGINGGCVGCYLWDFGEPWEIWPLADPEALKAHVKQFLALDLGHHFAWVPTTGEAFGPWYPINQEKIIHLVYYYVLFTGDTGFLAEVTSGRTILEWMLYHATYRDNQQLPVDLIDYGKGNNHLELRGTYRYDNYVPDLNARRYANMMLAAELARMGASGPDNGRVGASGPDARFSQLPARAEALKTLIKQLMWSPEQRWFCHLDENFAPDVRYTVQMFKPIGSDVLDEEELEGLISHLNDEEFLSAWGLHSMSKLDEAYDQVDIDNGGGGNYTAFTPQIIERLYKVGRAALAEDILRRVLWWGERMPYWGDSIVANHIDYRHDTPLQNTVGAVAGAQMVIFGMFGVSVGMDGAITVDPRPPSFAPRMKLSGLRLRGRCLDIEVEGGRYRVTCDGEVVESMVGKPVVVAPR